jgi:4-hydroxy-2-oxoglutarate aldolase
MMLKGILPPITTPFRNGEVAYDKLAENLSRWNKTGLSGYVVMGSNGESVFLSREEKLKLLEETRKRMPDAMKLVAGTGSDSITETVSLTNAAAERGTDLALILTPSFYKGQMNHEAFIRYYIAVADQSRIPLLIYNVTKFTGVNIEAETVAKLAEHPTIAGLKNSSENVAHLSEIVSQTPEDFLTFVGTASVLYPGLCVGAVGGILALANIAPGECVRIQQLFEEGNHRESLQLQKRLLPVNKAITARYGVPGLKAAMDLMGYYGGGPRAPLGYPDEKAIENIRAILQTAKLID